MTAPFTILLPPAWVRIPVDQRTDHVFTDLIAGVVAQAPPERRARLSTMLTSAANRSIAGARAAGAIDLILSFATVDGLPIPASIACFRITPPEALGSTPEATLLSFASPGSRAVEIDGTPAIRRVSDSGQTDDVPAHRAIHYVVRHPDTHEWLLITASILVIDDADFAEVLDAIEILIDAMASTIRFRKDAQSA